VQAAPPGQVPHLWVCSRCKLVFRSPDLRAEDHFDNVSYVDHANEADWRKIKERPFTEMVRRAAAYFDSAGPRRMVDFGCSYGHLALKFKAAGWEPIGVDVSQPVLEYHRQAGTMPAYAALDAPEIADGSVQLIAMSDVLCLVDRPVELLRTALRKLADPGLVFVRVSSLSRPIRIAVCLRRLFGIDLLPRLELDHKTYWTIQAARLAAERAGFDRVRVLRREKGYGYPNPVERAYHRVAQALSQATCGVLDLTTMFQAELWKGDPPNRGPRP